MAVEIKYKCHCMAEEVGLSVPSRDRDEDIQSWMTMVLQAAIYLDHRRRSPSCQAKNMEYAKIHLPENAEFIGQSDKH